MTETLTKDDPVRAAVIHPRLKVPPSETAPSAVRDPDARLEEAVGLAAAISLYVVHAEVTPVSRPRPSTLIGGGQIERLEPLLKELEIAVLVVDAALSPIQQRNLERDLGLKVIDRTQLILEIFGARARTHEGRLQVELASLSFQRSRLVRSWTHLERQRGGAGFLGGPGESQIELDRRLIDDRIVRLRRELEDVRRTRELHRDARKRVPFPIVALVGYTNAGKSTLFNRLSGSDVMAKDLLFATLDPTMRRIDLPGGRTVIVSDTVGFISDLPTHLVAAFRATLEEVVEADLVVHVRDVSHPDTEAQRADVVSVLADLEIDETTRDGRMIEVLNKIDRIPPERRIEVLPTATGSNAIPRVALSALTGEGIETFVETVEALLSAGHVTLTLDIDLANGAALAWLYQHGEVLERSDDGLRASVSVTLAPEDASRFEKRFGDLSKPAS